MISHRVTLSLKLRQVSNRGTRYKLEVRVSLREYRGIRLFCCHLGLVKLSTCAIGKSGRRIDVHILGNGLQLSTVFYFGSLYPPTIFWKKSSELGSNVAISENLVLSLQIFGAGLIMG